MRVLAVDFGGSRIGLAAGDLQGIASPLPYLAASGTLARDAQAILKVAKTHEAELIAVGLPLNEGGEETKMSRICRKLGDSIAALGMEVEYVDESFTSMESETALREEGLKASQVRRRVDGEAAVRIFARLQETRNG